MDEISPSRVEWAIGGRALNCFALLLRLPCCPLIAPTSRRPKVPLEGLSKRLAESLLVDANKCPANLGPNERSTYLEG